MFLNWSGQNFGAGFRPTQLSGLTFWVDSSDANTITKAYQTITPTGSGTIGTTTITASSSVATIVPIGALIRIGGTDIYTVTNVVTTTITVAETLTATYGAGSALALDKVSQWNDKSGSANNAVQGTAATQPIFVPNKTNGKSVLMTMNNQDVTMSSLALTGTLTIFMVNFTDSTSGTGVILGTGTNANTQKIGRATTTSLARLVNAGTADTGLTYPATGAVNIFTIQRNSANKVDGAFNKATFTRLFADVAQSSTLALASIFRADATTGQTWIGGVNEIIVYNTALTTGERYNVENYLSKKWGTP